ncbi:hypothetical protein [Aeromicrobium sp. UC242_57]|uniref:hypothetical protein n=1 Tax=Aeromicrobium sp. UC242_57 TaxID=3374624 RepID=UPI0037AC635F
MSRERRDLVGRCVAAARDQAGRSGKAATEATLRDVEQTVWAAIIDARAGATVHAGVLVKALSAGGFGEVDVAGVSALDVDPPAEPDRLSRSAQSARSQPASSDDEDDEARATERKAAEESLDAAQSSASAAQREVEQAAEQARVAQAAATSCRSSASG